ncbi:MAG: acyltransferase [Smithella sp.]|jgi:1-acyl-sn-glycerol-3-phosphate acyltransferase|nr:acyltransferase [Smithella sp.]
MLHFLPAWLVGSISMLLLTLNVIFWVIILLFFSFAKFLLPLAPVTRRLDGILLWIAENWIAGNCAWMKLTQNTTWDVRGIDDLNYRGWYLVVSNHQSWADIFVLQKIMNRRIPLLKFFLKRELIWVPLIGLAWWALDFPFLRRHSIEYLQKHPEQKGKDFETTRNACKQFTRIPTSVMNFLEGTRFTPTKHQAQNPPYQHLLKPKAGGMALALSVLGNKFHCLLNVTIVYPEGIPTFWSFLCGKLRKVIVHVNTREIPPQFLNGDYEGDKEFQNMFQQWVRDLWQEKDELIADLLNVTRS